MAQKKQVQSKANKFAENWLPIKSIANGAIILDNGQQVTGIKIHPRNIFIMDQESQANVILNLRTFYNQMDYEFWMIVADRPVDINVYLANLKMLYNDNESPVIRKLILEDIDKANLFMSRQLNVADVEYFILFRERKPEVIQKRIQNMITALAQAGIQSSHTTNDDLRTLMESFLNGGDRTEFGTVMG